MKTKKKSKVKWRNLKRLSEKGFNNLAKPVLLYQKGKILKIIMSKEKVGEYFIRVYSKANIKPNFKEKFSDYVQHEKYVDIFFSSFEDMIIFLKEIRKNHSEIL